MSRKYWGRRVAKDCYGEDHPIHEPVETIGEQTVDALYKEWRQDDYQSRCIDFRNELIKPSY